MTLRIQKKDGKLEVYTLDGKPMTPEECAFSRLLTARIEVVEVAEMPDWDESTVGLPDNEPPF